MGIVYHGVVDTVDHDPQPELRSEGDAYIQAANTLATIADTLHTRGVTTDTEPHVWWTDSAAGQWVEVKRPPGYTHNEPPNPSRRHTVTVTHPTQRMRKVAGIDSTVARLILSLVPLGVARPPYRTSVEGDLVVEVDGAAMLNLIYEGGIGVIIPPRDTRDIARRSTPARAALLHTLYRQRRGKGWR